MKEPWWYENLRDANLFTFVGAIGYFITFALCLLGWRLGRKLRGQWMRVFFRAGLVAVTLAPAILVDPGGVKSIVPAFMAIIFGSLVYLEFLPSVGSYTWLAYTSVLLVWCTTAVIGVAYLKLQHLSAVKWANTD